MARYKSYTPREALGRREAVPVADPPSDLTPEQRQVLQAVYDAFRRRGTWPRFGDVDRPLRRTRLEPAAIMQAIPKDMLRLSEGGRSLPEADDLLHLSIKGIAACMGGQEDVHNFIHLLPWLAGRELSFEPPAASEDTSLRV